MMLAFHSVGNLKLTSGNLKLTSGNLKLPYGKLKFFQRTKIKSFCCRTNRWRKKLWWFWGFLFVFSVNIANVSLRKYLYVVAIKIALFHYNGSTSNTSNLPQPKAPSLQNYTPVSAKFRHKLIVSFQTTDTTTFKTTSKKNFASKIRLYY